MVAFKSTILPAIFDKEDMKTAQKLHINQINLLWHLALFNLLDYESCLELLKTEAKTDRTELSYAFRPLTKNGYVSKRKDGCVSILAKGRALFPELEPLISAGGGEAERKRVMAVSRMAMWMEKQGFPAMGELPDGPGIFFIPSACWRKIAPGILSTTRFVGMLVGCQKKLAVYDIGDGHMEWQVRAEGSLFYTKYGSYETRATGMLMVCKEDKRDEVAQNIIRQTMWSRKQLLSTHCSERSRPVRWSHAPIKLKAEFEHVYLTTPHRIQKDIWSILREEGMIRSLSGEEGLQLGAQNTADIELWPRRLFVSPATDLPKYVRFFAAVKDSLSSGERFEQYVEQIQYELYAPAGDKAIVHMYPDVNEAKEEAKFILI